MARIDGPGERQQPLLDVDDEVPAEGQQPRWRIERSWWATSANPLSKNDEERWLAFRQMKLMFFPEYIFALLLVPVGFYDWTFVGLAAQLLYLAASAAFQLAVLARVASDQVHKPEDVERCNESLFKVQDASFLIPVRRLRVPRWAFVALGTIPNYLYVPQVGLVLGQAFRTWSPAQQAAWEASERAMGGLRRAWAASLWTYADVLPWGHTTSWGLPWALAAPSGMDEPAEAAGAANMLLLEKLLSQNWLAGVAPPSLIRLLAALSVKSILVGLKVSLLCVTFDETSSMDHANMLLAIALGLYSMIQVFLLWCVGLAQSRILGETIVWTTHRRIQALEATVLLPALITILISHMVGTYVFIIL